MDVFLTGFPKRLLVAVSVVIIIAMCLDPAEARSIEHKRRHQRRYPEMAQLTKENITLRRNPSVDHFKNATRKIKHKLRNTKRFFDQDKKVLVRNETRDYREGMPAWLPAVNFVDIHFHDYKIPRKTGKSVTERKFTYLMPKLYKTLKEYEVIFKLLLNIQVDVADDPFNTYLATRRKLLKDTLDKLSATIDEVHFNMVAVNLPPPVFDKSRMKLEALQRKVDATTCLKYDHIAFRGYGNLLNNWNREFRCPLNKKTDRKCRVFHELMEKKRVNKKNQNTS
ncbi:uncharacterized protein LOC121733759 [Aricia agestis]|uniref:uncharacterized protein LOC121733759 n=1 Tax=Aricia agestis TaxID=91739 RepID=UPI001C20B233|nr:uncharacterized protein LOC121733759 [Aricia agestis]